MSPLPLSQLDRRFRATLLLVAALSVGVVILAAVRKRVEHAGPAAGPGAEQHGDESEPVTPEVLDRLYRKRAVVQELLAGRLGLPEAAARFRALDRASPSFHWARFRAAYPGGGDEERHCREVIARVETELGGADPCLALVTRAALHAELEKRLKRGPLILPDASRP
jgi:hypothetical protein